ncbi:PPC domain-containing protein [Pseudogemmatithrix spongiicola]|uniref:PPC domain-containing protein n=1 Tax=Pseudogemmatithrix spongiicola TaxID=3062599 RepID=A0AA49JY66_9BACT|nr:PPC domain-containing protein [Gemmatimonadaceae bacterium 'strain 138']WKW14365.1 PPC domain-containing protein [Gemmatimonadaceae bacterium 'strain 318']
MRIRRGSRLAAAVTLVLAALGCNEGLPTRPDESPVLVLGEAVTVNGARGSEQVYRLTVPEGGGKLRVLMAGFTGDADLAVRYGAAPQPTEFDCASQSSFPVEECIFEAPEAGLWFISVLGYTAFSDAQLSASLLPQVGERALVSGVATTGLSGSSGDFEMFRITVPAGTDSLVVALDATGDPDLYVDFELFPLLNDYTCASFTETGSERCMIRSPGAGTWIIRVDAYLDFSAGTLIATVYPGAAP